MENDHHHHHSTSWETIANAAAEEEEEEQGVSHGGRSSATTSEGLEGWPDGESDGLSASRYGMEQMLRLAEDSEHATADYHRFSTRARQRNERGGPERAGGSEEEEVISEEWEDAMNEEDQDDGDDQLGSQAGLVSRTEAVHHVIHWLKNTYEQDNNRSISKNRLYEDYVRFCRENGMQTTTGPAFGKLVKSAFPSVKCCRRGPRSNTRHHYKHFFYIDKHMEQRLQANEMHLENMPRCTFSRALPADDFEVRSGLFYTWTMPSNQSGSRSEPNVSVAPSVTFPPTSASWPSALPRGRAPSASATTAPSTSSPHQRVRQRPYTSNKPHPRLPPPLPSDPYAQISPPSPSSSSYHPSPSSSLSSSSSSLMDYPPGFAPPPQLGEQRGDAVARTGPSALRSASSPPSSPSRWGHQRRPPQQPQVSLSSSSAPPKDRSTPGNHRSSDSPYRGLMGSGSESMATEAGNLATTGDDRLSTYMARSSEIPDLHNRLMGQPEPSFADFGPYAEFDGSTPSFWQPPLWPPQRPPQQDALPFRHLPPTQPSGIGATIVTKKRKSENERSSAASVVPPSVTGTPVVLARTLFSLEQEAATVEHPHHASTFSSTSSTALGEGGGGGGGGGQGQGPRGGGRGSGGGGGTTTRGRTSKSGTAGKRTQPSHVDGGLVGEPSSSPRSMDSFQTTPPPSASAPAQPHRPFPAQPQQSRSPPPAPPLPPSQSSSHYTMPPPGGPPPRRSSSASFFIPSSGLPFWFHITCPSLTLNPDSFFPLEDPVGGGDARAIAFREDICQFAADYQRYAQDLISAISQWNWNQIKDLLLDFWEHVRARFLHLLDYERLCQQLLSFEECMFANILQGLTSPHPSSASSPSSTSGQTTTKTATSTTSTERKSAQVAVPEKQRFAVLFPEWLFTAQNRVLPDAWLDQTVLASARFRDSLMLRLELQRLEVVLESIIDRSLASYPEGNSSGIDASAAPRPHATPLTYRMYEVWQQLDFDHINSDIILFVTYCGHNAVRLPPIQEDVAGLLYRRESLQVWTTWLRNVFFSATSSGSLAEGYIFAQQWERYSSCIWRELMRVRSSSPSSSSSSSSYQQQHQDNQLVLTAFRCFLDWMKAVLQRYNEDRSGSESVRAAMIVREAEQLEQRQRQQQQQEMMIRATTRDSRSGSGYHLHPPPYPPYVTSTRDNSGSGKGPMVAMSEPSSPHHGHFYPPPPSHYFPPPSQSWPPSSSVPSSSSEHYQHQPSLPSSSERHYPPHPPQQYYPPHRLPPPPQQEDISSPSSALHSRQPLSRYPQQPLPPLPQQHFSTPSSSSYALPPQKRQQQQSRPPSKTASSP